MQLIDSLAVAALFGQDVVGPLNLLPRLMALLIAAHPVKWRFSAASFWSINTCTTHFLSRSSIATSPFWTVADTTVDPMSWTVCSNSYFPFSRIATSTFVTHFWKGRAIGLREIMSSL